MVERLDTRDTDFDARLQALLQKRGRQGDDIGGVVGQVVADIAARGDEALLEYTRRFDWKGVTQGTLKVSKKELMDAKKRCPRKVQNALKLAATRITAYHKRQKPKDVLFNDTAGVKLGWKWTAIDAVGMYVPGGLASYPSSVLMNAIPARVAGVKRLVMVTPAPMGNVNPAVLMAASIAGIDEIYRIGGAQAVAALAYGTSTIPPVDKIVGPGNAYVTEAKRQVFGKVGIDMIAGPSEILVVADKRNNPAWIAADLLSQAEHDESAQSILVTDDADFARAVEQEVEEQLASLPRAAIAGASWLRYGVIITVRELSEAVAIIDTIAPEHVELAIERPELMAKKISHCGAIFMGRHTPEAIGDYVAGPSHVLPTVRTARFSSGLSVLDFMKRTSLISCSKESLRKIGEPAATLADTEGLQAHAASIRIRKGKKQ